MCQVFYLWSYGTAVCDHCLPRTHRVNVHRFLSFSPFFSSSIFLPQFVPFSIYLCTYLLPLVRAAVCSRGIVGLCCCGDASSYASCSISWCQQHRGPSTMKTPSSPTQRLHRRKLSECDRFAFALFACVWQAKREILINQRQSSHCLFPSLDVASSHCKCKCVFFVLFFFLAQPEITSCIFFPLNFPLMAL